MTTSYVVDACSENSLPKSIEHAGLLFLSSLAILTFCDSVSLLLTTNIFLSSNISETKPSSSKGDGIQEVVKLLTQEGKILISTSALLSVKESYEIGILPEIS